MNRPAPSFNDTVTYHSAPTTPLQKRNKMPSLGPIAPSPTVTSCSQPSFEQASAEGDGIIVSVPYAGVKNAVASMD